MSSFEISNVKDIYDKIYNHFDVTRKSILIDVKKFIDSIEPNSIIFDAGCGNGKNMYRKNCFNIGGDFCLGFLDIIKKNNHEGIQINVKHIPFANNSFDYTICIAVIHHIKQKSDQIKAIKELIRITRKKGKILISVWEKHGKYNHGDNFIRWTLQNKYNKIQNNKILNRYYYMFEEKELYNDIFRNINNIMIESYTSNFNNRFIILTKL